MAAAERDEELSCQRLPNSLIRTMPSRVGAAVRIDRCGSCLDHGALQMLDKRHGQQVLVRYAGAAGYWRCE